MCPICWTTAIASFSLLVVLYALPLICTDKWGATFTASLLLLVVLHRFGAIEMTWWCFVPALVAIVLRTVWLLARRRERIPVVGLWKRAVAIAARRCPRQAMHVESDGLGPDWRDHLKEAEVAR